VSEKKACPAELYFRQLLVRYGLPVIGVSLRNICAPNTPTWCRDTTSPRQEGPARRPLRSGRKSSSCPEHRRLASDNSLCRAAADPKTVLASSKLNPHR
jgi:hypothetical protein